MSSVVILAGIVGLFGFNLWSTVVWWRQYHDLRAIRAVMNAILLLLGALALAVATWALDHSDDGQLREILRILVGVGQGVLGFFGLALGYSYFVEKNRR